MHSGALLYHRVFLVGGWPVWERRRGHFRNHHTSKFSFSLFLPSPIQGSQDSFFPLLLRSHQFTSRKTWNWPGHPPRRVVVEDGFSGVQVGRGKKERKIFAGWLKRREQFPPPPLLSHCHPLLWAGKKIRVGQAKKADDATLAALCEECLTKTYHFIHCTPS